MFLVLNTVYSQLTQLDSSSFHFWIGEWNLHWIAANGDTIIGKNSISTIFWMEK